MSTAAPPSPEHSRAAVWLRRLAAVHGAGAREILEGVLTRMGPDELAALRYHWPVWARPKQVLPTDPWRVLLLLCGRGWGKTRTLNEWTIDQIVNHGATRFLLVGRTDDEAEKVIVKGKDSGLLAVAPPWFRPRFFPSEPKRIEFPGGAVGYLASAERPDSIRGDNLDFAVWDEIAAARPEHASEVMYNVRLALRGRDGARLLCATTSRKRRPILRELVEASRRDPQRVRVVNGNTFENKSNLPRDFVADLVAEYVGTSLEAQEIGGGLLDEADDEALWRPEHIRHVARPPCRLVRVAVTVDPAVSVRAGSDQTGLVAVGLGEDGNLYVLEDASGRWSADAWPKEVKRLVSVHHATVIVCETNRGGDLVSKAIRSEVNDLPITEVFSKDSKETRADPVARIYQRGRVFHLHGLDALELQMTTWHPLKEKSPDRIDALVHGIWHLAGDDDSFREMKDATRATAAMGALARAPRTPGELDDYDRSDEEDGLGGIGLGLGGGVGGMLTIG
jgi:phage terminase large subunit-like protein